LLGTGPDLAVQHREAQANNADESVASSTWQAVSTSRVSLSVLWAGSASILMTAMRYYGPPERATLMPGRPENYGYER